MQSVQQVREIKEKIMFTESAHGFFLLFMNIGELKKKKKGVFFFTAFYLSKHLLGKKEHSVGPGTS